MAVRPIDTSLRDSLLKKEPFVYAHLIKFERAEIVEAEFSQSSKKYAYLTDASMDIIWDDNSTDISNVSNGLQNYRANKVLSISNITEGIEAKAFNMNLRLSSNALNTYSYVEITSTSATPNDLIVTDTDLVMAGFAEGDKIVINGSGSNEGDYFRIEKFSNDNKTIKVSDLGSPLVTQNVARSQTIKIASDEIDSLFTQKTSSTYANYINREVFIYKAHLSKDTGTIIGEPYLLFKGIITTSKVVEDPNKGSTMDWGLTSHWGDFQFINGRLTSDSEHRALGGDGKVVTSALKDVSYAEDLGFLHSEQALNLMAIYQIKETRYRVKKKKNFFGRKKIKMRQYEVEVDREIDLRFNLQSKKLPVIYGVRKIDSFPIFVDTDNTDASIVYAAYALCEGEIGGIYDIYFNGEPSICIDKQDEDVRGVTEQTDDSPIDVVCRGRMDRGDTLTSEPIIDTTAGSGDPINPLNQPQEYWEDIRDQQRLANYQAHQYPPINDMSSTALPTDSGVSNNSIGLVDGEGHFVNTPIDTRLVFHNGSSSQRADDLLVSLADSNSFKIQNDYYTNSAKYWGTNHRLLDTAYIVAKFKISEGETEIPSMDYVVRGKVIPCYNYDFAYRINPDEPANVIPSIGDKLSVYKLSDNSSIANDIIVADVYTFKDQHANDIQMVRLQEDPGLGSTTEFYLKASNDTAKCHLVTYNREIASGTVGSKLETDVVSAAATDANDATKGMTVTSLSTAAANPFRGAMGYTPNGIGVSNLVSFYHSSSDDIVKENALRNSFIVTKTANSYIQKNIGNSVTATFTSLFNKMLSKDAIKLEETTIENDAEIVGAEITVVHTNPITGSIYTQRKIIDAYDSARHCIRIKGVWNPKFIPGGSEYTYSIRQGQDNRISINPAMQLLDYMKNTRYGRGLKDEDIDLASFLSSARLCDTRSDIYVQTSDSLLLTVGDVIRYPATGTLLFQGTVASVENVNSLKQIKLTDCIGKLANKWLDWKSYDVNALVWSDGNVAVVTAAGTVSKPTSISVIQVRNTTSSVNFNLSTSNKSFEGNPVVLKYNSVFNSYGTGYTLYDSDEVKYWRYVGWDSQHQRHVTRHQTNAVVDTTKSVFANVNDMLSLFNGMLRYVSGKYNLDVRSSQGVFETVSINIDEDAATETVPLRVFNQDDIIGAINVADAGVKGSYNTLSVEIDDPQNKYEERQVSFFNSDYLKEDRNIPKKGTFGAPGITNYFNARINAKQYLDQSRYSLEASFTLGPEAILLIPGELIKLTYPRFGWTNKLFRVTSMILKKDCLVDLSVIEHRDDSFILDGLDKPDFSQAEATRGNFLVPAPPTAFTASQTLNGAVKLQWTNTSAYREDTFKIELERADNSAFDSNVVAIQSFNSGTSGGQGSYNHTVTETETKYYRIRYAQTRGSSLKYSSYTDVQLGKAIGVQPNNPSGTNLMPVGLDTFGEQHGNLLSQVYYGSGAGSAALSSLHYKLDTQSLAFNHNDIATSADHLFLSTESYVYNIPVESGKKYIYSMSVYPTATPTWFRLYVRTANGNYQTEMVSAVAYKQFNSLTANTWQRVHGVFEIESGQELVNVAVFAFDDTPSAITIYIDEVMFEEYSGTETDPQPSTFARVGGTDGAKVGTNVFNEAGVVLKDINVANDKLVGSVLGGSLVSNPSLDSLRAPTDSSNTNARPVGWYFRGNAESEMNADGDTVTITQNGGGASARFVSSAWRVNPGTEYEVTIVAKSSAGDTIALMVYDTDEELADYGAYAICDNGDTAFTDPEIFNDTDVNNTTSVRHTTLQTPTLTTTLVAYTNTWTPSSDSKYASVAVSLGGSETVTIDSVWVRDKSQANKGNGNNLVPLGIDTFGTQHASTSINDNLFYGQGDGSIELSSAQSTLDGQALLHNHSDPGVDYDYVFFSSATAVYNIPVEAGKKYIYSVKVYPSVDPAGFFRLYVRGDTATYFTEVVDNVLWKNYSTLTATTWQRVHGVFEAPSGVELANLSVWVDNNGTDMTLYYDELMFEEYSGNESDPQPSTFVRVGGTDGATAGTNIFTEAGVVLKDIDVRNDQLVTDALSSINFNPSMSLPADRNGTLGPAGYITNSVSTFPTYKTSARDIAVMSTAGNTFNGTAIQVNPDTQYEISAWVRAASGVSFTIGIRAEEYDADLPTGKTHIGFQTHTGGMQQRTAMPLQASKTVSTTEFTLVSGTYVPNSGAKWFSPSLYNGGTGNSFEVDWLVVRDRATVGARVGTDLYTEAGDILSDIDVRNDQLVAGTLGGINFNPSMSLPQELTSGLKGPANYISNQTALTYPRYVDPAVRDLVKMNGNLEMIAGAIRINPNTRYEISALIKQDQAHSAFTIGIHFLDSELPQGKTYIGSVTNTNGLQLKTNSTTLVRTPPSSTSIASNTWTVVSGLYTPSTTSKWFSPYFYSGSTSSTWDYQVDWVVVRETSSDNGTAITPSGELVAGLVLDGGSVSVGKTSSSDSQNSGFWLGTDGSTGYDFNIGNNTNFLKWDEDVSTLSVAGTLQIGGGPSLTEDNTINQSNTSLVSDGVKPVSITGNKISIAGSTNAWDTQVYSRQGYSTAYVSFVPDQVHRNFMMGLDNDPTNSSSYTHINYKWYIYDSSAVDSGNAQYRYNEGTETAPSNNVTSFTQGDVFTVSYDGSTVRWLKNGDVKYSRVVNSTTSLYLDSSFASPGQSVSSVQFGPITSNNYNEVGGTKPPSDATAGASAGTDLLDSEGNLISEDELITATDRFNGAFSKWTSTYPAGWITWNNPAGTFTKEQSSTLVRVGSNAVRMTPSSANNGISNSVGVSLHIDTVITGSCDVYIVTNTSGGAPGGIIDLYNGSNYYRQTWAADPTLTGTWQTVWFTISKDIHQTHTPVEPTSFLGIRAYLMSSWGGVPAGTNWTAGHWTGDVIYDNFKIHTLDTEMLGARAGSSLFNAAGTVLSDLDVRNDQLVTDALGGVNSNPSMSIPADRNGTPGPAGYVTSLSTVYPTYKTEERDIIVMPTNNVILLNSANAVNPDTKYEISALVRTTGSNYNLAMYVYELDTDLPTGKQYVSFGTVTNGIQQATRTAGIPLSTTHPLTGTFSVFSEIYEPTATSKWFSPALYNQNLGIGYEVEWLIVREMSTANGTTINGSGNITGNITMDSGSIIAQTDANNSIVIDGVNKVITITDSGTVRVKLGKLS